MYVAGRTEVINQFLSVASSVVFIISVHADIRGRCGWSNLSVSFVASSKLRYQHGISHLVIHKSVSSRRRTRHLVLHPSVLEYICFRLSLIIFKCVAPVFAFATVVCHLLSIPRVFLLQFLIVHMSGFLCSRQCHPHFGIIMQCALTKTLGYYRFWSLIFSISAVHRAVVSRFSSSDLA